MMERIYRGFGSLPGWILSESCAWHVSMEVCGYRRGYPGVRSADSGRSGPVIPLAVVQDFAGRRSAFRVVSGIADCMKRNGGPGWNVIVALRRQWDDSASRNRPI